MHGSMHALQCMCLTMCVVVRACVHMCVLVSEWGTLACVLCCVCVCVCVCVWVGGWVQGFIKWGGALTSPWQNPVPVQSCSARLWSRSTTDPLCIDVGITKLKLTDML